MIGNMSDPVNACLGPEWDGHVDEDERAEFCEIEVDATITSHSQTVKPTRICQKSVIDLKNKPGWNRK